MAIGNVQLTPQLVQAVRDAVDVVEIASDYTRLRRGGRSLTGLCPLHKEKTPSFSVDQDKGVFYCFGCGRGGDAIKLHMELTGDDFPTAIENLANRYGIPIPARSARGRKEMEAAERHLRALEEAEKFFVSALARAAGPRTYLERRQISPELVERFGLGFAPDGWRHLLEALHPRLPLDDLEAAGLVARSDKPGHKPYDRFRNRLIFPIRSAAGRLVGFGGRTLGDDQAKYLNTSETASFSKGRLLYGLDLARRAIRERGRVLLVEGYFDVIGAVASGIDETVAVMGTALTEEQSALLARYSDEVIVGYDGDDAGENAFRRAMPLLLAAGLGVRRARFDEGHDPDSLRQEEGEEAVRRAVDSAVDGVTAEIERLTPTSVHREPRMRAEAAREITRLLRPIPDAVLRYGYAQQAAERLGVPVELLMRGLDARPRAQRPEEPTAARPPSPVKSLEEAVLHRIVDALGSEKVPSLPPAERLPEPEVFLDPACRNIFGVFSRLYKEGGGAPPSLRELRSALPDQGGEGGLLARLLMEERSDSGREQLPEVLDRLKIRWLKARAREIAPRIAEAERSGDSGRLERLLQQREEILRERTELTRALGRTGSDLPSR
jgi:DNA primase